MATEGRRPPISGGSVDVRRTSISMSHGPTRSFSSSPPAFGDIPPSFLQGSKTKLRLGAPLVINEEGMVLPPKKATEVAGKGKGVMEENLSNGHMKNRDLLGVREFVVATSSTNSISTEDESAFTGKQTVFQKAAENQIYADDMMVQAMDEARMDFLDIIATEGNGTQGLNSNDLDKVLECNSGELGACKEAVDEITERSSKYTTKCMDQKGTH